MNDAHVEMAFAVIDQLLSTRSGKQKQGILAQHIPKNRVLMSLLFMGFNEFLTYNIKQKPKVAPQGTGLSIARFIEFMHLLADLDQRVITGNEAKKVVAEYFSKCSEQEFNVYWAIMKKDWKIGLSAKTVNEVYDFIPFYECMLAHPFEEKRLNKGRQYILDKKLDGFRINAYHDLDGKIYLLSRNGHKIEGFDGVEMALSHLPKGYMYDGELMAPSGKFNDMQTLAFKDERNKEAVFHIFDVLPIEEFKAGKSKHTLRQRKEFLEDKGVTGAIFQSAINTLAKYDLVCIELVEYQVITYEGQETLDKIMAIYHQHLSEGLEGTMVKDADSYYQCKRSHSILKIKPSESIDVIVVDMYEGKQDSKYEGMLGGLICDWNGVRVKVGGGFSDKQRSDWWKNPNLIVGKTIEVLITEYTQNKEGNNNLRFGRFKKVRLDK